MAPFIINPIVGIYWVYPMLNWSRSLSECPFSMTHDISNVRIWKARVCKTNNIRSWWTFRKQLLDTWKISSNLTFIALLKKFRFPSWVCQRTTALSVDGTLKSCGSETQRGNAFEDEPLLWSPPTSGRDVWRFEDLAWRGSTRRKCQTYRRDKPVKFQQSLRKPGRM